MGPIAV